jgi:hypothetical protein
MEGLQEGSHCSEPVDLEDVDDGRPSVAQGDTDAPMQGVDDPYDFACSDAGVSHPQDMAVEDETAVGGDRVDVCVPGGSKGLAGRVSGARTSSEPAFEADERLHRYWASGIGMCRDAHYNAMKAGGVAERMEKLRAGRDAYAEDVRNRELAKLRAITLEPRPVQPSSVPGLYHLRSVGVGVLLPWKWEHRSGDEFVREWEVAFPTDEFKGGFYSLYGWWISMKKVIKLTIDSFACFEHRFSTNVTIIMILSSWRHYFLAWMSTYITCHIFVPELNTFLFLTSSCSLPVVFQHDSAVDPAVRAAVSSSLEALACSVREGKAFDEARALGDYIQWRVDQQRWDMEKSEYDRVLGRLQAHADMAVVTAAADYMREHAYEEEAAMWDWCPVWHAITGLDEIRKSLPPLPFKHDGEYN